MVVHSGPLAERMRSTRARFKLCLKWRTSHMNTSSELNLWQPSWLLVTPLIFGVEEVVGEVDIATMWGISAGAFSIA